MNLVRLVIKIVIGIYRDFSTFLSVTHKDCWKYGCKEK